MACDSCGARRGHFNGCTAGGPTLDARRACGHSPDSGQRVAPPSPVRDTARVRPRAPGVARVLQPGLRGVLVTRIDADYNERDDRGRVVAGVPARLLAALGEGQAVTLHDPVGHLLADARVAWTDAGARAAGFDVDWASFRDCGLPEAGQ